MGPQYGEHCPIYLRLADRFRQQILSGVLAEGEQLPSVRALAGELAINPNTIGRAYRELESQGWVVSVPGKGVFVADRGAPGDAHRLRLLEELDELADRLEKAGMTRAEIAAYLEGGKYNA